MKKTLLFILFAFLVAGLHAQRQGGNEDYRRYNEQKASRTTNNNTRRSYEQDDQQNEGPVLDSRKPSDKLQMTRPVYRGVLRPEPEQGTTVAPKPIVEQSISKDSDLGKKLKVNLPAEPVSGPGNPFAPPLTQEYPPMPHGDKIFECRFCHYIYYTYFMPEHTHCELPGQHHDWQVIGKTGYTWYRCLNCNTYVSCSGSPRRSYCGHEKTHVWILATD